MASGSEEENKMAKKNEASSGEKLEVLPAELIPSLPEETPSYLIRGGIRSFNTVATIRTSFLKNRLSLSALAINLYFDSDLKSQLYKALNASENDQIKKIKLNPYITLTMSPFNDEPILETILQSQARKQKKIPLSFSSTENFGNSLGLSESETLNDFHSNLCTALEQRNIEIQEKYRHRSWVPDCQVAYQTVNSDQAEALNALLPYHGCGIKIKLEECPFYRDPYVFNEEEATFLFRKVISDCDHMLSRFSVPKIIAKNLKYFPFTCHGRSVDIEVWVRGSEMWVSWDMVLRHYYYMVSTYQIIAFCKKYEEPLNLVAGDAILFYKLKSPDVFQFPYRYMIQFERANRELESDSKLDSMEHPRE